MNVRVYGLIVSMGLLAAPAFSQEDDTALPPQDGRKASEIVATIEQRPDFRYLETMRWNDDGYYEIVYHTADKARVEIDIDPSTGQPR